MTRKTLVAIAMVTLGAAELCPGADASAPKIDKPRLENYIRYAEGYTPAVKLSIDDPAASAFPNYYRVVVHASSGSEELDRVYYVTADGSSYVSGNVWKLNQSPFLDTLDHLPADGPSLGPANARVTVVVFSDFECPYCRQLAQTIRQNVSQKYPKDVQIFFADFPLEKHVWARPAAEAAHCVGDGNPEAFWAFHDWIFEHQQEVDQKNVRDKVLAYVKDKNLDSTKITACMDTHAKAGEVAQNEQKGRLLQVQQTPTLFINGRMIPAAVPWQTLDGLIQYELNRPSDIALPAWHACCEVSVPTVSKR
jgi:protein-disulfide isomerase